jgi:peptide/nickel transport system permease protein
MLKLLASRLLATVPLMFAVATLVFFLSQLNPVDPAAVALGDDASPEAVAQKAAELGTDQPVFVQYWNWLSDAATGDLGVSWFNGESITRLIADRAPVTLSMVLGSLLIALLVGVSFGVIAALNTGRFADRAITVISSLGIAVPNFWVGIILVYYFAVRLGWFPAIWNIRRTESISGWIHTIILPCIALGTSSSAAIARQTRSSMISVLQRDYIRTALAKGLPVRSVITGHALRNAAIPVVTLLGFQVSALIGGTIFVELVFNIPGLGSMGVEAVLRNNTPIVLAFVMITTLVVVVVNIVLDLSYAWLNPKVRPE